MAVDPLIAFSMTILPLLALIFGILVSLWGAVRVDRWLLLGTVLLGLMGGHQLTEAYQLVLGGNPYPSLFGEGFETAVNLLAAGLLWVVTRRILTERRHREQQAVLARELELPYAACAVVANWAAGLGGREEVAMSEIEQNLRLGMERVRELLGALIPRL